MPQHPTPHATAATGTTAATATTASRAFRGRIGADASSGFYAAPHRYELFLSPSCPSCLRIAITHGLLGLEGTVALRLLPADPSDFADPSVSSSAGIGSAARSAGFRGADDYSALRAAYEATCHGHPGPAAVPALTDRWTGRVVSNHAPDILRDLALRFPREELELYPAGAEGEIGALTALLDTRLTGAAQRAGRCDASPESREAALGTLLGALHTVEDRLTRGPYVLGERLTAADVHLWVALVELDTVHRWHLDAAAVHRVSEHQRLWAYARGLLGEREAFRAHLDIDALVRGHHRRCRGQEAAGAAVQIVDWSSAGRAARSARTGEAEGAEGAEGRERASAGDWATCATDGSPRPRS
jgi:putative glutathione S-transferase